MINLTQSPVIHLIQRCGLVPAFNIVMLACVVQTSQRPSRGLLGLGHSSQVIRAIAMPSRASLSLSSNAFRYFQTSSRTACTRSGSHESMEGICFLPSQRAGP